MIAYLKGKFTSKNPSNIIIDVNGVGYEVHISLNTYSAVLSLEEGLLFTHLLIKEDAHLLYGFADVKEKDIFLALLSVSGIGANTARLILSYMKPDEIIAAIIRGDSHSLEKIKGIGKKTAERTILELKDKIGKQSANNISVVVEQGISVKTEAIEALQALGIHRTMAEQAVSKSLQAEPEIQLEELIKKALKSI
ncbi:MAG: Holliday junction DNA helicase RuvA [Sphingobacteriales bacterium 41-5]|nr:MAG: Holliday junction DNA helicase RuvA [Sphingobacteriales bacterium 41-5]